MRDLNTLVSTINSLSLKGLYSEAAFLSRFLRKYGQQLGAPTEEALPGGGAPQEDPLGALDQAEEAFDTVQDEMGQKPQPQQQGPSADLPTEEEVSPEKARMERSLYYKWEKWHEILDEELPKYDYLEDQNIEAIRSSLAKVHRAFEQAIQSRTTEYDREQVNEWNAYVNQLVERMHDIQTKKLDRTRAIVDAYMLYGTTNRLFDEFKRIAGHDTTFSNVLAEFSNLVHVFTQVIKRVPEQISGEDLTRTR